MLVIGLSMTVLLPSATIQSPLIERPLSVPLLFSCGLPGSLRHSTSVSHSPTNCPNQSCSGPGFRSRCSLSDNEGSDFPIDTWKDDDS